MEKKKLPGKKNIRNPDMLSLGWGMIKILKANVERA